MIEWHIDTDGLRVGSKLWSGTLGWVTVKRIAPGKVWVLPDERS